MKELVEAMELEINKVNEMKQEFEFDTDDYLDLVNAECELMSSLEDVLVTYHGISDIYKSFESKRENEDKEGVEPNLQSDNEAKIDYESVFNGQSIGDIWNEIVEDYNKEFKQQETESAVRGIWHELFGQQEEAEENTDEDAEISKLVDAFVQMFTPNSHNNKERD